MPQPVQQAPQTRPHAPRVEDFPPVVKAEFAARAARAPAHGRERGPLEPASSEADERASPRKEEEPAARLQPPRHARAANCASPRPEARRLASQDPQLYAPRRGQLDEQGRVESAAACRPHEDDQLEIPAFLRRQAN
jgi:cell division protein FtsZ